MDLTADKAVITYLAYLKANSRPNTIRSFQYTLVRFQQRFANIEIKDIGENDILTFLLELTEGTKQATKSSRASVVRSFYNFISDTVLPDIRNPCNKVILRKIFKKPLQNPPELLDKDVVDEIIFRTTDEMERLILELMGRAGMRIGEVLAITPADIDMDNSAISIKNPKSKRVGERVYVPKKLIRKLDKYISDNKISTKNKCFPISYSTAYRIVSRCGRTIEARLRPHDLRRHAATQASRGGMPLEIVSRVVLRHADIATTQRYLGKVDPDEARRWVETMNR